MSYYVRFEVAWDGEGPDPFAKAAQRAVEALVGDYLGAQEEEVWLEWVDEFGEAFAGRSAEIKGLTHEWAEGLMRHVTAGLPGTGLWARGVGEELDDAWVLHVRDGEVVWSASFLGERRADPGPRGPAPAWPAPLELARVVAEAGLLAFAREILAEQPPSAEVGGLTLQRSRSRKPRALAYVGPLGRADFERIRDLFEGRYRAELVRDPRRLASPPTATADDPRGFA